MFSKTAFFSFAFSLLWLCSFSQPSKITGCAVMKNGVFKYLDIEDTSAYIIIKNGSHTEYHNNGKYYITSNMQWVNDCEYNMVMMSITIPNFPFKPGDVMNVKITAVSNGIISYTATVKGNVFNGRLKIIKASGTDI